jgi:hypothetical protein
VGSTAHAHYPMKRYRWSVPCKCAWVGAQRVHGQGLGGGYSRTHRGVSVDGTVVVVHAKEVRCLFCILEEKTEDFYSQKVFFYFTF